MKNPIVVTGDGDIRVFRSPEAAFEYLETIDIENDEYSAYDGDGNLLYFDLSEDGQPTLNDFDPPIEKADALRDEMIRFFTQPVFEKKRGYSLETLSPLTLTDLIDIAAKHTRNPAA